MFFYVLVRVESSIVSPDSKYSWTVWFEPVKLFLSAFYEISMGKWMADKIAGAYTNQEATFHFGSL